MRNLQTELRELIRKKKESSRRNIHQDKSEINLASPVRSTKRLMKCESTDNFSRLLTEENRVADLKTELTKKEQIIEQQRNTILEQQRENAALRTQLAKYKALLEQQAEVKKDSPRKNSPKGRQVLSKPEELLIEPERHVKQEEIQTKRNAFSKRPVVKSSQQQPPPTPPIKNPPVNQILPTKSTQPPATTPKKVSTTQTQSSDLPIPKSPKRTVESILRLSTKNFQSLRFKPKYDN